MRRLLLGAVGALCLGGAAQTQSISTPVPLTTPGGSNTQVQFNNSSAFGGASNFTWDGTNLAVPTLVASGQVQVVNSNTSLLVGSVTNALRIKSAAAIVEQYNSTTGQTFRVYNTFTDASNYERAAITWSSNVGYVKPENAGTGTARLLVYVSGSTTVSGLPAAATAGAGAHAFVTDATACVFNTAVTGSGSTKCPVVSDGSAWNGG